MIGMPGFGNVLADGESINGKRLSPYRYLSHPVSTRISNRNQKHSFAVTQCLQCGFHAEC